MNNVILGIIVITTVFVVLLVCLRIGKMMGYDSEGFGYRQYLEQTALKVAMYLNVESAEFVGLLQRITAREEVTSFKDLTDEELVKFINAYGAVRGIRVY